MHERASRQNRKIAFQHVWRGGEYRKTALAIALLLAAAFVARADTVLAFSPSGTGTHATESIPTDVSLLADGVTVAARDTPTVISGALTIAGGGTVALPAFDASFSTWSLFTMSSISGAANLAGWSFTNLPRGKKAMLHIQGNAVIATVADAGMMLIFR